MTRPLSLRIAMLVVAACMALNLQAAPKPKKELYVPMDYSTCGYHASEAAIPDIAVKAFVAWQGGDCSERIQQAIDYVAGLKPDKQGHRGCVLLGEGTFIIGKALHIDASGVVLRGVSRHGTVLRKTGVDRGAAVYINLSPSPSPKESGAGKDGSGDTIAVTNERVDAGSTQLAVQSPEGLKAGSRIHIVRPCTKEWIMSLKMNDFGGGLDYTGWKPTDIDITWDRTITAINGNVITIDAPITTTITEEYGGAYVVKLHTNTPQGDSNPTTITGEINECGIENLTIEAGGTGLTSLRSGLSGLRSGADAPTKTKRACSATKTETETGTGTVPHGSPVRITGTGTETKADCGGFQSIKDEDHCWDGVYMNNVRDSWVRKVVFRHLAGSAVNLQKATSRITVEDCIAQDPVSETGGWRRQVFLTRGQQTLFQRCISRHGIHDFAAGFCAAGPNAFVQCEGEESLGFSGSIGSWAAGLLFDIVNIDGNDIRFANLEQFQFGTGWNTGNSMLWQCTASTIECYSPDADSRNSGHGCWGTLTGNGEWTSSNDHVSPRSLFYDQLKKRLGTLPLEPYILPRPTNATSSPTAEQAMECAQASLTRPRLTMEMWIDSIPFRAEVESRKGVASSWKVDGKAGGEAVATFGVTNGCLTANGKLLTGNQYHIPWWSGRVKDNFVKQDAKPAITRFVPGREGTGWTDHIDSVVGYLADHHYSSLYHHYGLWYDLRRTDHERVRRADGDVWAPFYEQPFARTGAGTAWDGLSRYDLTKPNRWYWSRLNEFAKKAAGKNIMLYNECYFQHNILEAGAHWVDCPWRPVNNVNLPVTAVPGETPFPEPVPFDGDKRVFMAEQFYNEQDPLLRPLHRQYIRMCLDQMREQPNVIHSISAEYTGPLHFTRFWLETIAEWEAETGCKPLIALSCTKDVQDSILSDENLRKVVDIIDIRYWHYNTDGLWAPEGGGNMSPRQWMRKMKVGKTGFDEAYRAVKEYRERYPEKAVTFNAQQYPSYGWAILLAGGSLPNIPMSSTSSDPLQQSLLQDICKMKPCHGEGCVALGGEETGYLVYTLSASTKLAVTAGTYNLYTVDTQTGAIALSKKNARLEVFQPDNSKANRLFWLRMMRK